MKKLRVGVIYGGRSGEHEVSLASAAAVFKNLDPSVRSRSRSGSRKTAGGCCPIGRRRCVGRGRDRSGAAARIAADAEPRSAPGRPARRRHAADHRSHVGDGRRRVRHGLALDVVFPVLHGPYGEDGTVQGLLELANMPYVGAGVLASAVGMDKAVMKLVFAAQGPADLRLRGRAEARLAAQRARDHARASSTRLGFPVFVKPANLGSSVGISKAKHAAELRAGDRASRPSSTARSSSKPRCPTRARSKCAVLGNDEPEASVPGEIIPSREFYDYEAKYLDDGSTPLIPAPLTDAQATRSGALAIAASRRSTAPAWRASIFCSPRDSGMLYLTSQHDSRLHDDQHVREDVGGERRRLPALLDRLIALALERHADKQQLRTSM